MENLESLLRNNLRKSKLVYLAFPDEEEVLTALMSRLSQVGRKLGALPQGQRGIVLRENLATYLVGVTYAAWENYSDGTLWRFVEAALGNPPISQQDLADYYRFGLDQFGLDRFQVREMRNISEILLHSGIPKQSQATYLDRLIRTHQRDDGITAEEFNLQIRNLKRTDVASKSLDVPTWRFISQAQDIAEDLTEKCLEVLDDIADDGEWNSGGGEGLPAPMLQAIVSIVTDRKLSIRSRKKGPKFRQSPSLHLDPQTLELRLVLPQIEELRKKPVSWTVTMGEEQLQVTAIPELQGLDPKPKQIAISQLVREIYLESDDGEHSWNISLFDPETPISFFKLDGRALPDSGSLPGQEVFVLAPLGGGSRAYEIQIDGNSSFDYQNYGCPSGWNDDEDSSAWRIFGIDLTGKKQIRLIHNGRELEDSTRHVGQALPSFGLADAALSNFLQEDLQVFYSLPKVFLPGVSTDQDFIWNIRLRFETSDSKITDQFQFPCSTESRTVTLPAVSDEAKFAIAVEGKKGSTQRCEGFLLANALAEISPPVRGFVSSGLSLEDVTYKVSAEGQRIASGRISGEQVEDTFLSPRGFSIRVRPAHAELQEVRGVDVIRHLSAPTLEPANLVGCKLRILWPGKQIKKLVAKSGGELVQELIVKDSLSSSPFANLGELTDTAKEFGQLDVFAQYENTTSRVASVRSKKVVESCKITPEGFIEITSSGSGHSLLARIYPLEAPWLPNFDTALTGSSFSLPSEVLGLGKIGVSFKTYDPWVPAVFPAVFSFSESSFILDSSAFETRDDAEGLLAKWFRDGVVGDGLRSLAPELCARLLMDDSIYTESRDRSAVTSLALGLAQGFSKELLPALVMQASRQRGSAIPTLFALDLVDKEMQSFESASRALSSAPYLNFLSISRSMWSSSELAKDWCLEICGTVPDDESMEQFPEALGLLDRNSLLSDFVEQLLDLDFLDNREALQIAKQRLGALPGPPLHRSKLAGAILTLLNSRRQLEADSMIRPLLGNEGLSEISREMRRGMPPTATRARTLLIGTSRPLEKLLEMGGNTVMMTHLSIGLALLARFSPWNQKSQETYQGLKPLHARLAQIVPDLVEHDLIVAELLASHNEAFGG